MRGRAPQNGQSPQLRRSADPERSAGGSAERFHQRCAVHALQLLTRHREHVCTSRSVPPVAPIRRNGTPAPLAQPWNFT